jgi:hypothetical protein|tara:strand:- start:324 stop:695 length:372 start_codon:yes stop_codon:yes gene_type:complete
MKKLILPVLLGMLLVSSQASFISAAPSAENKIYQVPISVPCGSKKLITKNLKNLYGQVPMAQGNSSTRFIPNTKSVPGILRIWTNTTSWTFTITIESPVSDAMCILNVGTELEPVIQGDKVTF